ncbi:hypothetical protein IKF92_00010 [Candidatus Saccharibacteria bacterium]|nr:hypothetical protein [Candidatus Saccharibacteria bacterium]
MYNLDEKDIIKTLKIDARALGIPSGAAEVFIQKSVKAALNSLQKKSIITDLDVKKAVTKELKKYHADLAYVFENRDKIV